MRDQVVQVDEGFSCIVDGKLFGPYRYRSEAENMLFALRIALDMMGDRNPKMLIKKERGIVQRPGGGGRGS